MHLSIKFRLTAAFLALAILPLVIVGVVLALQGYRDQRDHALALQEEVALRASIQVTALLDEIRGELAVVAETHAFLDLSLEAQRDILSLVLAKHHAHAVSFSSLSLLDGAGRELAQTSRTAAGPNDFAATNELVVQKSIATGEARFGNVRFDDVTGEPVMAIVVPKVDPQTGRVEYLLGGQVGVRTIWDLISDIKVGDKGFAYIVDFAGRVVAHPNPSVVLRGTIFALPNENGVRTGLSGDSVILASQKISLEGQTLFLVTERPVGEMYGPIIRTEAFIGALIGLALLTAIAFALLTVRRIVWPLQAIATTALAITKGDLEQRADESRTDEIGDLARSFNEMTSQMQGSISSLRQAMAHRRKIEEELAVREQQFRELAEHANDVICHYTFQPTMKCEYVSPAALAVTGYAPEEWYATPHLLTEILHPKEKAALEAMGSDRAVEPEQGTFRIIHKDGHLVWLESRRSHIRDADGKLITMQSTLRDVTESKKAEEALKASEAKNKALLNALPDTIFHVNAEGRILEFASKDFAGLVMDPEEIVGRSISEVMPTEFVKPCMERIAMAIESGLAQSLEYHLPMPDGPKDLDARFTPNGSNEVIVFVRDATEAKRARREVDRFFNLAPDLLVIMDMSGFVRRANPAFAKTLGFEEKELTAQNLLDLVHPDDVALTIAHMEELQAGGSLPPFENRVIAKDGSVRWLSWVTLSAMDEGLIYAAARDVTERKGWEEEVAQNNQILSAVSAAQTEFISESNPSKAFDLLLHHLLDLTKSEYGFIGEVLLTQDGEPYLRTHAITNIAWDDETRGFYEENALTGMAFFNLNNLFGSVIRTAAPVTANDPGVDPRRGGLPEGHPGLRAFLGLPFFKGQVMNGMVGIANRPGGYDQHVIDMLQPFLATCSNLVEAHRNEQRRLKADGALKESEERYRDLFENATDLIQSVDDLGHFIYVNGAWLTALGYKQSETSDLTLRDVLHPDTRDESMKVFDLAASGERFEGVNVDFVTKDGRLVATEGSLSGKRSEDKIISVRGIFRDITLRRIAEETLERVRRGTQLILDNVGDGI
ncbi:MAG: PAS domain S-box protein, partial [Chloroflexi bacterium]|nr:PAS domain S-box protein [Chloroflexota bacterium]